jgi:hypothetical protein
LPVQQDGDVQEHYLVLQSPLEQNDVMNSLDVLDDIAIGLSNQYWVSVSLMELEEAITAAEPRDLNEQQR